MILECNRIQTTLFIPNVRRRGIQRETFFCEFTFSRAAIRRNKNLNLPTEATGNLQ